MTPLLLLKVTASFLLVIVSMCYYTKPAVEAPTPCGSLLPDWQSVATIFAFYTIIWMAVVVSNIWFIRQTRRKANTETSNWVILTHPGGRLLLGQCHARPVSAYIVSLLPPYQIIYTMLVMQVFLHSSSAAHSPLLLLTRPTRPSFSTSQGSLCGSSSLPWS